MKIVVLLLVLAGLPFVDWSRVSFAPLSARTVLARRR